MKARHWWVLVLLWPAHAKAEDLPPERVLLGTAQVCYLEAAFRRADCAAMVGVAKVRARRQRRPWFAVLRQYSGLDSRSARAALVRAATLETPPAEKGATVARWAAFITYVREVVSGRVPSPCARASHWGAPNLPRDVSNARLALSEGRWTVVDCRGTTANRFYREVAK